MKEKNDLSKIDDESSSVNKKRRSLTKTGLAAPVIMCLANRPAFGAVCTVSGFISATPGDLSSQRHVVDSCGGFSPGAWCTPYNGDGSWLEITWDTLVWTPGGPETKLKISVHGVNEGLGNRSITRFPSDPAGTTMATAFGYNGYLGSESMYDVLWMGGTADPEQFGAHIVAALLNAAKNIYPANTLTVAKVRDMYKQLSTGTYEAAPGVFWSRATTVAYIQQTFHSITPKP